MYHHLKYVLASSVHHFRYFLFLQPKHYSIFTCIWLGLYYHFAFFFSWLSSLEGTKWMTYLANLLRTACLVVNVMSKERRSVVVHCSDGWDRTSQIVSLAELIMDPYYRTVEVGQQTLMSFSWKVEQILVSIYPLYYKSLNKRKESSLV